MYKGYLYFSTFWFTHNFYLKYKDKGTEKTLL